MSRGLKILQLITNKPASSLLNLPSYETTHGLGRDEQNLACENWYKFSGTTSASQVRLAEHEEHRKITNTNNVTEVPLSTAESSSIGRNVKRNIKNKINLQKTCLVNEHDNISDNSDTAKKIYSTDINETTQPSTDRKTLKKFNVNEESSETDILRDSAAISNFTRSKAKYKANRIIFENVSSESIIFNDFDISDDDRTYQPTDEISSCSSDSSSSSSSSKQSEITQNSTETIVKSDFNNFKCVPTSNPLGTHTKQFFCIFCKTLVRRFARHLITLHKREPRVIDILRYPLKHPERNRLITKVRNEGTILHNTSNVFNKGQLIVSRRPNITKKRSHRAYSPCPYCFGYYIAKNLHRHTKSCFLNKNSSTKQGTLAQSRIIQLELDIKHMDLHSNVPLLLSELKNDEVSHTIKHDVLLLRHASYLCKKYGTETQLKHHSRQKLRQLARLLLTIKEINPEIIDMKDCLQPVHFDQIIAGIQKLCGFNDVNGEFKVPSMATHLGIYLKEITNVLYSQCIIEQDEVRKKIIDDFRELISLDYGASISRSARKTLEESKWNKPKLLPVTKDIKTFRNHLMNIAESACCNLERYNFSYYDWRKLTEVTAVILLIFNRKRPGETERILLQSYYKMQSIEKESEDYKSLTTLEKLLCSSFKRVEIRGKLGRRVPILLRENHIRYIDTFLKYRKDAGVPDDNIYLFGMDGNNFVHITDIIRREAALSGVERPELLRATYLRKQVATTAQVLDLNDNEMQMLADFMGHDIDIHKAHYRTPELILQVARLSKLLIAVDEGDLKNYKDKNLKNLDIEKYLHVSADTEMTFLPNETLPDHDENDDDIDEPKNSDHSNEQLTSSEIQFKSPGRNQAIPGLPSNEYIKTPPKNHQSNSNSPISETKQVKRKHFRSPLVSNDKYAITPPKRPKIRRVTWRTPEKKIVRSLFKNHLVNRTLPSEAVVMRLVKQQPELLNRTAAQVKAWINNQNRKKQE